MVASLALASCTGANAVLLSIGADAKVEQYDLYVRDDASSQVVFHSGFNAVQVPGEKPRDLTSDKLKIALKMPHGGSYTLLIVGVIGEVANGKPAPGATQLFWAGHIHVDGTTNVSARLLTVQMGDDADGDLWPDATRFVADTPDADKLYKSHPDLLDCFDDPTQTPMDGNGMPIKFKAADINPFAVEVCGDGFDEDCNGDKDEQCIDHDKDGDPSTTDCDDNDPKRHHATAADPFPDPPNCCGYNLGKQGTADENKDFSGDATLCPMARCGDGIDESCQGHDTTCVIDADCDGYPAPPQGNDCDDHDPTVHPNALEPCGSTKDLNCDGIVNGGCVPCDLDGDGFERMDPTNGCPDKMDKNPGKVDCNDADSSVFPGATSACGGSEAGNTSLGRLTCSLRGGCRRVFESTGSTANGTPKIAPASFLIDAKWTVGDNDCNGTAFEGCPPETCDADGDGWPVNANGCAAVDGKFDCDDTDPTIYPGAPVSCGSGPAEDCTSQKMPCTQDADHDGWNAGVDCDDGDATVHPWAPELCDGKDNDCDGLVDEGNPDVMGKPLVASGAITTCTDNNLGECAKTLGACVCSVASPMSQINASNRTICPTEDSGSAKPPRCFGAGQPHPQTCHADSPVDDDCDGKTDDPTGMNLAEKGKPCGINGPGPLSQCKQGIVIGCDHTKTNCFEQFGRIPTDQAWYVCSTDAVCPEAEKCDGYDNDCDGNLAGNQMSGGPIPADDEIDHDGDHWLACTGCSGLMTAPGVLGCSDCDDTNNKVFPGAFEYCDNINNACDPAWGVGPGGTDGKDECQNGTSCCSSQTACKNLGTDKQNCGACGTVCDPTGIRSNLCDPTLHCACNRIAECPQYNYCDSSSSNGSCHVCDGTNNHCGDSCGACGAGQKCQADKNKASGYSCGCTDDSGCTNPAQPYCNKTNGACQALAPQGHMCGGAVTCSAGLSCVDSYCCNSSCTAACSACNVAGSEGACTPLAPGSNPVGSRSCTNLNQSPCGGKCTGAADCTYANTSTKCTPNLSCTGSTLQNQSFCDGAGGCTTGSSGACGGHLICADSMSCKATCGSDTDCTPMTSYYCSGTTCTTKNGNGANCTADDQCSSGHCVDGACCGVASCGPCLNCKIGSVASGGGTCIIQVKSADDTTGTTCQASTDHKSCDSNGACKLVDGQTCSAGTDCVDGNCASNGAGGTVCCNIPCSGQCATSQFCSGGTCHVQPLGTSCGAGGKFACDGMSATCPAACSKDAQCASGNCCNNDATRVCAPTPGDTGCGASCTACTLNSNNEACVSGACGCNGNGDCTSGNYCNTTTHLCAACTNSDNDHCGSSCAVCTGTSTPICSGGVCQCTGDGDCPSNQYCKAGTPNTCTSQIANDGACAAANCVTASCRQCSTGGTCPAGGRCPCASDSDCSKTPAKPWCKAGATNLCAAEIASGGACNPNNCVSPAQTCAQCTGAVACPSPSPCP